MLQEINYSSVVHKKKEDELYPNYRHSRFRFYIEIVQFYYLEL